MTIADNICITKDHIQEAVSRRIVAGAPGPVKLVAVTKNQSIGDMKEALTAGISAIGENRIQEAVGKFAELGSIPEWHLIGHLQTNKVHLAVPIFDLIHSVDSERLAVEINRIAGKMGKRQNILLQVNVAGEATKYGIAPEETLDLAWKISKLESLCIRGLMTIAPYYTDKEDTRLVFRNLYGLFTALQEAMPQNILIDSLSMGMTNDYTVAIEEGANIVRIGTGIFGARK
ncbi:MAG: hypothetical protein H6Q65_886 [Firmicutes bacterium]|nr:hypothetical protein [Bacillota bacterium]